MVVYGWMPLIIAQPRWIPYLLCAQQECVMYYIARNTYIRRYPVIENWFFGAVKGSKFIRELCKEFMSINDYDTVGDYVDEVEQDLEVDLQGIVDFDDPEYLTMHVSVQKILQIDEFPLNRLKLVKAESEPFKYLKAGHWDAGTALKKLCRNRRKLWGRPLIKFTGPEREYLEKHPKIRDCIFNDVPLHTRRRRKSKRLSGT